MKRADRRILMIGLDGFDISLANQFAEAGLMPNFKRVRSQSVRVPLDCGRDRFSGLAWEHFSSGRSPLNGSRWSAIHFDPAKYTASQKPTSVRPFPADLRRKTVVFDVPYFDLRVAPDVEGVTNWGAHDPGVDSNSRPTTLHDEIRDLFGPYPAADFLYGFCWASEERTRRSSEALARAVDLRRRVARWLLVERLSDWRLALVVVSECHSAVEPLWHGIDTQHPLHVLPSAKAAMAGLQNVYSAIDALIGGLAADCPDANLVLFSPHGMGPNNADVAAMALLPELLYRAAFGEDFMRSVRWAGALPDGTPLLTEDANWEWTMEEAVPQPPGKDAWRESNVSWMPAYRYRHFWSKMPAFALPSFYDGRMRINLRGREAHGVISSEEYQSTCQRLSCVVSECVNLLTMEPAVEEIYKSDNDPMSLDNYEADLYVVWKSAPLGLFSPRFGNIGPLPFRRTGGHTGQYGFLYVSGEGLSPHDVEIMNTFDVVPTLLQLLGEFDLQAVSGRSFADAILARQA